MESLTKKRISKYEAKQLFEESGIGIAESINEINESEFSSVFKVTSGGKVYYIKFGPDPEAQTLFYEKDLINVELRVHAILDAHASETTAPRHPKVVYSDNTLQKVNVGYIITEGFDVPLKGLTFPNLELRKRMMLQFGQDLAKLHKIKGTGYGYMQIGTETTWAEAYKKMVDRVLADATVLNVRFDSSRIYNVITRAEPILKEMDDCALVNGDVSYYNVFVDRKKFNYQGLVNWGKAFYGDPLTDLVSLRPTRSIESNRWFVKGYTSVTNTVPDYKIRVRANLMRLYIGLIMLTELEVRFKKNSLAYLTHRSVGRRVLKKALSTLEKPYNEQTKGMI